MLRDRLALGLYILGDKEINLKKGGIDIVISRKTQMLYIRDFICLFREAPTNPLDW